MLLQTPSYLLFLAVVAAVYWAIPNRRWQKIVLLVASYTFYGLFDVRFAFLLAGLSAIVYLLGWGIARDRHARLLAWTSVAVNLGVLGVFKYADFFLSSVQVGLQFFGVGNLSPGLKLILPIGISFYTFQAISYTTEIYRKKLKPAGSLLDFALYLAFFPKLIAGPLVRPANFFKQLDEPGNINAYDTSAALRLLVLGLVKKILIADSLASLSAVAFRAAASPPNGGLFPTPLYIQGFYLYAFQIYADFSGYTDIARASAALLGFHLPENFQQPYLSTTITKFWNNWHMTLTQWFREYLFFPLSRKLLRVYSKKYAVAIQTLATLVTMGLIGFWHGAAWIFLAWGLWHGLLLTLENLALVRPKTAAGRVLQGVFTFHLVGIGWVLFGSASFEASWRYLGGLASFTQMNWLPHYLPSILLTAALVFGIDLAAVGKLPAQKKLAPSLQPVVMVGFLVVLSALVLLSMARGGSALPFIYGRF